MARRNLFMKKSEKTGDKKQPEKNKKPGRGARTMQQDENIRHKIGASCLWGDE
jgi:hypothetical protein